MIKINPKKYFQEYYNILLFLLIICLIGTISLGFYFQYNSDKKTNELFNDLQQEQNKLSKQISDIETVLVATQEDNLTFAEALEKANEDANRLKKDFARVNNNVQDLEKITNTDKELLQKYSKVYFLNEHYIPTDLTSIDSKWGYDKNRDYKIHTDVWPYLEKLLEDAEEDGLDLQIISAFRSFGEQALLKEYYTVQYGSGANAFSADQGYSEHQLGTTVDFTNSEVAATFSGFARSPEYKWLQENAHRYGFILSYPETNLHYQFEPWHWRFVGVKLAKDLHRNGTYFYDENQRVIDKYIISLFD